MTGQVLCNNVVLRKHLSLPKKPQPRRAQRASVTSTDASNSPRFAKRRSPLQPQPTASNPVSVPVPELNLSTSTPSR